MCERYLPAVVRTPSQLWFVAVCETCGLSATTVRWDHTGQVSFVAHWSA